MGYDAVLFDNDGVLTTPTDLEVLRSAARSAFEDVGVTDPAAEHVEGLIAGVDVEWFEGICEEYDLETAALWRRRDRRAAAAQRAEIREGRKRLYDDVEAVASLDPDLGIVSTNQHETIEFIVEFYELDGLFGTYYGREPTVESLRRKKPAPHYVERALADLDAEEVLLVGDSDSDVAAAANAGVDSAFVRRPHREGYALSVEPTYEIETLAEVPDLAA